MSLTKCLVTQVTLVWFVSCVDSHVKVYISRLIKHLVTYVTFVWFLSTVNSAVSNKITWRCKSFAANCTFKRFLSRMTSTVYCQCTAALTTFATFYALVLASMNIHVKAQALTSWKTLLTLATSIQLLSSVSFSVSCQTSVIKAAACTSNKQLPVQVTRNLAINTRTCVNKYTASYQLVYALSSTDWQIQLTVCYMHAFGASPTYITLIRYTLQKPLLQTVSI